MWQSNYYGSGDKVDVHYDIYLFDLQNQEAALSGSKPVVVEKGPYAFKKYFNRFDVSWGDDGDTVTYTSQVFFMFNPDRTGGYTSNASHPTTTTSQTLYKQHNTIQSNAMEPNNTINSTPQNTHDTADILVSSLLSFALAVILSHSLISAHLCSCLLVPPP